MGREIIASFQNPKVKLAKSLWDRRDRDRSGLFLIEGYRELSFALGSRFDIQWVFFSPHHFLGENEESLLEEHRKKGAHLFEVAPALFESSPTAIALMAALRSPEPTTSAFPISF